MTLREGPPEPEIESFTIYHSPNAYLGIVLAGRALADLPIRNRRRPIFIPADRGPRVADLVGGRETPRQGAYHRLDGARWAKKHGIPITFADRETFDRRAARWRELPWMREELPARAYYAACGTGREEALDRLLFEAAWVKGLDVNEEATVRAAILEAGLEAERILGRALGPGIDAEIAGALAHFDDLGCPGVPCFVYRGELFFGKDRVDWLVEAVRRYAKG